MLQSLASSRELTALSPCIATINNTQQYSQRDLSTTGRQGGPRCCCSYLVHLPSEREGAHHTVLERRTVHSRRHRLVRVKPDKQAVSALGIAHGQGWV